MRCTENLQKGNVQNQIGVKERKKERARECERKSERGRESDKVRNMSREAQKTGNIKIYNRAA